MRARRTGRSGVEGPAVGLRGDVACMAGVVVLAAAALLVGAAPVASQSTHMLVVTGLGGAPEYTRSFAEWGQGLVEVAREAGVPEENVTWLAESGVAGAEGVSRKEQVTTALERLAGSSAAGDLVVVALFGHGSARGDEIRVNLPGPDLTADELALLLEPLEGRRVVVVNAASSSGGFVAPLSAPGRVVITATRSVRQNEATRFGGYFVEALAGDVADTDKDGSVSFLEAFEYARLEVARAFADAGQLPTEHALLDDNGDGQGSMEPGDDGALARTLTLSPAAPATADPALAGLLEEEARLRGELEALRARQGEMEAETYQAELEQLLLEIARNGRAIRDARGEGDGDE